MIAVPDPEKSLPLSPAVFNILLALADDEKHGYAIMQEVEEQTGGAMKMGPGTLYGALDRMLEAGLVTDVATQDSRRRYYRLTDFGTRVLRAEVERLRIAVNRARNKGVLRPSRETNL